jgi:hypothetical protein
VFALFTCVYEHLTGYTAKQKRMQIASSFV